VDVYLGDRKLGTTPLAGVAVPAGKLRLRLVNKSAGIDRAFVVDVKRGETVRRTVTPDN
jgi:hypothetical protein